MIKIDARNRAPLDWFLRKSIEAVRHNDRRTTAQIIVDQSVADLYAEGETELAAAILLEREIGGP